MEEIRLKPKKKAKELFDNHHALVITHLKSDNDFFDFTSAVGNSILEVDDKIEYLKKVKKELYKLYK